MCVSKNTVLILGLSQFSVFYSSTISMTLEFFFIEGHGLTCPSMIKSLGIVHHVVNDALRNTCITQFINLIAIKLIVAICFLH